MSSLAMCDLVSHDRPGHDPVPHRRAPGVLGGSRPGNITGGKRGSGKTTKGDVWLIDVLTQCAWAAAHPRHLPVGPVPALARRIGKKKAAIAVAHSILVICWHLLTNDAPTTISARPPCSQKQR